jgi:hypothetical protein
MHIIEQGSPRPNQAVERTAARRPLALGVANPFPLRSTLAVGGRRSLYSR